METDKLPSDHVHGLQTRWTRFISLLKIFKKNTRTINQAKIGSVNRLSSRTCTSSISCTLCAIYIILLYIRIEGQIIINWKIVGYYFLSQKIQKQARNNCRSVTRDRNVLTPPQNRLMEGT